MPGGAPGIGTWPKMPCKEAFCAVAGTADPQHIIDLRAYFCRVLIRAVYFLHGQLRAIAVEDPEILTEMRRPWSTVGAAAYPQPFEEAIVAGWPPRSGSSGSSLSASASG